MCEMAIARRAVETKNIFMFQTFMQYRVIGDW